MTENSQKFLLLQQSDNCKTFLNLILTLYKYYFLTICFLSFHAQVLFYDPLIDALREKSYSERRKEDVEETSKIRKKRKRRYCEELHVLFGSRK